MSARTSLARTHGARRTCIGPETRRSGRTTAITRSCCASSLPVPSSSARPRTSVHTQRASASGASGASGASSRSSSWTACGNRRTSRVRSRTRSSRRACTIAGLGRGTSLGSGGTNRAPRRAKSARGSGSADGAAGASGADGASGAGSGSGSVYRAAGAESADDSAFFSTGILPTYPPANGSRTLADADIPARSLSSPCGWKRAPRRDTPQKNN